MKYRFRPGLALLGALAPLLGLASAAEPDASARPWALDGQMVFQRIPALETMAVDAIAQDPQGFLWFGSQSALLRWDGYHLRSFARNPEAPGSMLDNFIRSLLVDDRGRLWVGTNSGGLSRYEPETDDFVSIPVGAGGTRNGSISALISDRHAGLWIGTGAGLEHLEGTSGRVDPPDASLPQVPIAALLLDRAGALWVGTRKGLLRRSAGDVRFQPFALPAPDGPAPTIRSLREDSAGRIWIGTKLFGAFVLDPGADRAHRVLSGPLDAAPLAESVVSILESGPGEVWLATEDSGIVRVDTRTWRTVREQSDATRTASLPSNQVATLFRDDGGTIWIGATSAPVSRVEPTQRQIQTFYGGTNRPDLLLDDRSISALLSQPDGRVWMGLGSGGIEIVDPASGRVGRIRTDPDHPDQGLPKAQVVTMARWSDGSVFLGTAAGLYRAGADGRTIERLQVPHEPRALDVRALLVRDGHLLVGGLDGLADLAVTSAGRLELVRRWDREIGDARVRTLVDGKGQGVWIGTPSGAALLDWAGGGITRLAIDPRNPDDLPGGYISSLLTDRRGRLWVATFGRGIQVERGRDAGGHPIFQRLTQSEGLPQNSVDALLADAHGNIWASTDGGLAQVHPDTLAIRAFRTEQGVGLEGFFTGIATVTAAGDLLFGGVDGLVVVHPDRVVAPVRAERVVPTEIRVGGRVLPPSPALYRDGVRIDPSDRSLAIEFAALDFDDPHARRYAYRLRGFDAGWVDTPASRRLAAYTNLPPGDYVLQLRSAGLGGPWSAPLEIPVHVQPAWYEYAAVRALAALLVLSLIAGLVHARMLLLRRRQAELESIVAERTAQLRKSQEYLASMAYMDALTQLPNRRMFNDQLRRMIAGSARGQGYFALLLIDLDGFKRVNDSFGHDAGDGVLVAVATRLRALIRETDLAARLGGDEFGVILAQTGDRAMVDTVCARIVKKLREPVVHAGHIIAVGASIGIAGVCDDIGTPEELYKAADAALYEAKRDGRNTWRWDPRTVTAVGA